MATKSNGTVAGGNDEASEQVKAEFAGREDEAKAAEAAAETDEKVQKAHDEGTAAEEGAAAQGEDVALGVDGKTAVTFYNPAPKAVRNRDLGDEATGYSEKSDDSKK
jgi:hypothetical protein